MNDSGRLFGVRAIVYGASSGIGEAIARTLCKHNAQVLAVDTPQGDFERQFAGVPGAIVLPLPRFDDAAAVAAIGTAVAEFGGLDVVVESSELQPQLLLADEVTLQKYLSTRLQRLRNVFDSAWPYLKKSPAGRIIAVGALRSAFALDGDGYAARAEAVLAGLIREFAAKSGQFGVSANYLQPGAVMTAESRRIYIGDKALRDRCIAASAARRIGDPIDIAKVALFLASDDSAFVSGTGIRIDGGAATP